MPVLVSQPRFVHTEYLSRKLSTARLFCNRCTAARMCAAETTDNGVTPMRTAVETATRPHRYASAPRQHCLIAAAALCCFIAHRDRVFGVQTCVPKCEAPGNECQASLSKPCCQVRTLNSSISSSSLRPPHRSNSHRVSQVDVGGNPLVPTCTPNDAGIDHCCLPTGTSCTQNSMCCGSERCLDVFGSTVLTSKTCMGECSATGESCSARSECCGGDTVRPSATSVSCAGLLDDYLFLTACACSRCTNATTALAAESTDSSAHRTTSAAGTATQSRRYPAQLLLVVMVCGRFPEACIQQ